MATQLEVVTPEGRVETAKACQIRKISHNVPDWGRIESGTMSSTRQDGTYDIVLLADCTRKGDVGLRIAQEIRTYTDMGCRVGIVQLQVHTPPATISPDIQLCVREGLVDVLPAQPSARTKLAIVHSPSSLQVPVQNLSDLSADQVVFVHERKPSLSQMGLWLGLQIGPVTWAPTNRWVRTALAELNTPVPLLDEDWRPVGRPLFSLGTAPGVIRPTVIGRVSDPGPTQWPKTKEDIERIYPIGREQDFRAMGTPPGQLWKKLAGKPGLTVFASKDVTVERFVEMLDIFMYFPGVSIPSMPEAAIASAMASGKLVMLPKHLECHFGPGAIYADAADARSTVEGLLADEDALETARNDAARYSAFQFSETSLRAKVLHLLEEAKPRKRRKARKSPAKRVLFVPSNGVGLGHVTRLLSIARRLEDQVEPIFATMAQAAPIIESFGYRAEYIPSQGDTNTDPSNWDAWFRSELGALIDRYEPSAVVFDGNNPTPGLVHGVLSRGRCGLVWVRRGMVGPTPSPYLDNARFMDRIIEPGETAAEWDHGPTAARQNEVMRVDPITLLDQEELLPRKAALKALGLSPENPSVLVQLGAGANRDVVALTNEILEQLQKFPNLQIVLAEWENSPVEFSDAGVTRLLRGFPLSRFFKAFDFSISAAGYNTFHEVVASGLPTIFFANRHPAMDEQGTRAAYMQEHGAAFDLPEDELFHLPALCEALLNKEAQAFMRDECQKLYTGNGAAAAARAIMDLVDKT